MEDEHNCIFTKILSREIPAEIVYEDDYVLAFLDINPLTEGHTLVIPKKTTRNLHDLDEETAGKIMMAAKKIAVALKKSHNYPGVSIAQNNDFGQEVPYYHLHVYGRSPDHNPKIPHSPNTNKNLQEAAEKIKAALN